MSGTAVFTRQGKARQGKGNAVLFSYIDETIHRYDLFIDCPFFLPGLPANTAEPFQTSDVSAAAAKLLPIRLLVSTPLFLRKRRTINHRHGVGYISTQTQHADVIRLFAKNLARLGFL